MRIQRVRLLKHNLAPGLPGAPEWARALADPVWLERSTLLKQDGRTWVRRAALLNLDVVVKAQILSRTADRLKAALGQSRADRHWRGAAWLTMKHIACARVLARARAEIDGRDTDLLIMERVEGPTLLHAMRDAAAGRTRVRDQHALAVEVGAQVRAIADAAGYNRDHKPSNIIIHPTRGPVLIDCVAIRHGPFTSVSRGAERMLASLLIEPTGCGVTPRLPLIMRGLHTTLHTGATDSPGVRELWSRVARAVFLHGDSRPRIDPLDEASPSA